MSDPSNDYRLRLAEPADLPAVADIYNHAVRTSTVTFDIEPWSEARAEAWLREHAPPHAALVAERDGRIDGWATLSAFGRRPAYARTAEDSVYIRHGLRRTGLGRALLVRLLEVAAENGFHTVIARIALPNDGSVALHERLGFQRVGLEREVGYKFERWLDVMVMQRMVDG
jgi:L-amino acid N-acyltransferase YncA